MPCRQSVRGHAAGPPSPPLPSSRLLALSAAPYNTMLCCAVCCAVPSMPSAQNSRSSSLTLSMLDPPAPAFPGPDVGLATDASAAAAARCCEGRTSRGQDSTGRASSQSIGL